MAMPQRKVHVPKDLDLVTSMERSRERDPRQVGMTPDGIEAIWRAVQRLYRTGVQPGMSLCVRRRGKVVLDRAIGHSRGRGPSVTAAHEPATLMTPDTPVCVFSTSKALTAGIIHLLDERNLLRLDDPVAEYIEGFGQHGKGRMTIRHVLNHRAGIPSIGHHDATDVNLLANWPYIIEQLCETKPLWAPGRRLAYHAISGGFVLGEIAQRVTGRSLAALLREEFATPLGCKHLTYGCATEVIPQLAVNHSTGVPMPPPIGALLKRALGVPFDTAVELSNDPRFLAATVPSGNVVATADDLARYFQMLLDEGRWEANQIMQPRTVRRALVESAYLEVDLTLGLPIRNGQGFMLGAPVFSLYGWDTPHAFGHYGFTTVVGWADPERDLAAALLTTGKGIIGASLIPFYAVLTEIARQCPRVRTLR